jgi:hypothetical protein
MDSREEPGKQKPRSCRAQESARSRAQENAQKKKVEYRTQRILVRSRRIRRSWKSETATL